MKRSERFSGGMAPALRHGKAAKGRWYCRRWAGLLLLSVTCLPSFAEGVPSLRIAHVYTKADGLPGDEIFALRAHKRLLWVGTNRGLARIDGGRVTHWTRDDGLPFPVVSAIDVDDATGDVWLGTLGGGLFRFTAGRFDVFDQISSGLAGNLVFDVLLHGGRVYAATNGGLSVYDPIDDSWELQLARRADAPEIAVNHLVETDTGLLAVCWRGPLLRKALIRGQWENINVSFGDRPGARDKARLPSPVAEASIGLAVADGDRVWWVWRGQVVERLRERKWRLHSIPRVAGRAPMALDIVLVDGQPWLATDQGILALLDADQDRWSAWRRPSTGATMPQRFPSLAAESDVESADIALPSNHITAIAKDDRGRLWIGTDAGLALASIDNEKPDVPRAASDARPDAEPRYQGIGILGPRARTMTLPGGAPFDPPTLPRADLLAVQLALESRRRTVPPGSGRTKLTTYTHPLLRYGWGLPEDDLGTFVTRDDVTAIVGTLGPERRIAELAILRTRIPFVNAAPLDLIEAWPVSPHAWWFPCWDDRPAQLRSVFAWVVREHHIRRPLIVRSANWAEDWHARQWLACAEEGVSRGVLHAIVEIWRDDEGGLRSSDPGGIGSVAPGSVDAVFVWADASYSARLLNDLRGLGDDPVLVGSDGLAKADAGVFAGEATVYAVLTSRCRREGLEDALLGPYADRNIIGGRPRPADDNAIRSFLAADHLLAVIPRSAGRRDVARELLRVEEVSAPEAHLEELGPATSYQVARLRRGEWARLAIPPAKSSASTQGP